LTPETGKPGVFRYTALDGMKHRNLNKTVNTNCDPY
jgi:hypothetical protein